MNMEIFKEFFPSFSIGLVVGMMFILAACVYVLNKADKDIKRLEKEKKIERDECARLTKENQALREANQQIGKESFEEGILKGKYEYFLNEVKA